MLQTHCLNLMLSDELVPVIVPTVQRRNLGLEQSNTLPKATQEKLAGWNVKSGVCSRAHVLAAPAPQNT